MPKVLRISYNPVMQCCLCGSIFEYCANDIRVTPNPENHYHYVVCPVCSAELRPEGGVLVELKDAIT